MKTFNELVQEELKIARSKHGKIQNIHEGYSVLLEEVDEVWDLVKKKTEKRDLKHLLKELVQCGAMCQKMAEDVVIPFINKKK